MRAVGMGGGYLADELVVGVAAAYALWPRDVVDLEVLAFDGHGELGHVVHRDHLL